MNRSRAHSGNVPAYYVHSRYIGVSRTRRRRRDINLAGYIEHVRGLQRQINTAAKEDSPKETATAHKKRSRARC